ncbi:MAG: hypothetical protein ACI8XB_000643 [Patiriisocius sp.]|jgi:hypothetical protein
MRNFILIFALFFLSSLSISATEKEYPVDSFRKVIVSPHIQVNFIKSNESKVVIDKIGVSIDKMNVEVVGNTLRLYLDDAKIVTKTVKEKGENYVATKPIYPRKTVKATVYYRHIDELSLRGEETFVCESPIEQANLRLKIYGESQVYLNKVDLTKLEATIYGESYLKIVEGTTTNQKFKAYGESVIDASDIKNKNTKIVAYGDGSYRINVSGELKVTSYGEAKIAFEGNPKVNKGIVLGEATIQQKQICTQQIR